MNSDMRDVLICDGCTRRFALTTRNMARAVNAYLGQGEWIDFHSEICFITTMARGGELATGRGVVVTLFGKTPAEHVRDATDAGEVAKQ